MLVDIRTLVLHHAQDQINKLPNEIRDQLTSTGKIEGRLRRLERIDLEVVSTLSGEYRLSWLIPLIDQDRAARRQVRQLERNLGGLLDEPHQHRGLTRERLTVPICSVWVCLSQRQF
jgi:hypothetical protein